MNADLIAASSRDRQLIRRLGSRSDAWLSNLRSGIRMVAPLAVVIGAIGVLFGNMATHSGLDPMAAVVMSATTFTGSAQFAAIAILGSGGSALAAAGAGALLNARYLATGLALAPSLLGRGLWERALLGQLAVDESWAVAHENDGGFNVGRLVGAGALLWIVHVGSTAIGAFGGSLIDDPDAFGLDAAFPALFVVLLWPHLSSKDGRIAAVVGGLVALALVPVVPAGIPYLGAAVAAAVVGWRVR